MKWIYNGRVLVPVLLTLSVFAPVSAAEPIVAEGITEPFQDVLMSPAGPGIIHAHFCKEGDAVDAGQVVIEQHKTLQELEVERRRVAMDTSRIDYEGTQALYDRTKSVSRDEVMNKESIYKVSLAELAIAEEQLKLRQIISPFSGYVVEIFRDVGESSQQDEPLIRLVDNSKCYLVCNIEARIGYDLEMDQEIRVEIDAGRNPVVMQGHVSFVSPIVDPASGLLKVKVLFDNPAGKVRPGVAGRMFFASPTNGN